MAMVFKTFDNRRSSSNVETSLRNTRNKWGKENRRLRFGRSLKYATPAAWVKLARRAWMVSFAFRSSNSSTGQEVTTHTHTHRKCIQPMSGIKKVKMKMKYTTKNKRWRYEVEHNHTKSWRVTKQRKRHAIHDCEKHMQQIIPAKSRMTRALSVCQTRTVRRISKHWCHLHKKDLI